MILERLKTDIEGLLRAWAAERGLASPPPVVLKAPPEHVQDVDVALPWPLAAAKSLGHESPLWNQIRADIWGKPIAQLAHHQG